MPIFVVAKVEPWTVQVNVADIDNIMVAAV
jgi:hypothetical protein